jgi:hypothetical protein
MRELQERAGPAAETKGRPADLAAGEPAAKEETGKAGGTESQGSAADAPGQNEPSETGTESSKQ